MAKRFKHGPWLLTDRQVESMRAVCRHGHYKVAASELGVSVKTVDSVVDTVKRRMGFSSGVLAILAFDRWDRWNDTDAM